MDNFRKTFRFTQHTPILHFQHNQGDAVLRATELKPKLDKFLIKNHLSSIHEDWIKKTDRGEQSLDYKIKIFKNPNSRRIDIPVDYYSAGIRQGISLVLTNMGRSEENKTKFVHYKNQNEEEGDTIVEVFSFHEEIIQLISENICAFFQRNNFGNRQTKGFGSYYLAESDSHFKQPNSKFRFSVDMSDLNNEEEKTKRLFENIHIFWEALRGGIQDVTKDRATQKIITTFYFKSLMFMYARSMNIQWEKKTIKENIFLDLLEEQQNRPHAVPDSPIIYSERTKYLMKDLLGLSTSETWLADFNDEITKKHRSEIGNNQWSNPTPEINRLTSPVIFKPIFNRQRTRVDVFIAINIIPEKIRNEWFEVSNRRGNNTHIQFPPKTTANGAGIHIVGFFEFLFVKRNLNNQYLFDLENHIENRFKTKWDSGVRRNIPHEKWELIKDIFQQIRTNAKTQPQ